MLRTGFLPKFLNRKGQSIVEISLITPLLLVALYVPIDFAVAHLTAHLTQNAVRDAARVGAASKNPFDGTAATAIRTDTVNQLPARLISQSVTVKFFDTPGNCMKFVEVSGQGNYDYFFYQFVRLMGGTVPPFNISRTTRMRYEFQSDFNATPCATASVHSP